MLRKKLNQNIFGLLTLGVALLPTLGFAVEERPWSHQGSCSVEYQGYSTKTEELFLWEDVLPPIFLAKIEGDAGLYIGTLESSYREAKIKIEMGFSEPENREPLLSLHVTSLLDGSINTDLRTFNDNFRQSGDARFISLFLELRNPIIADLIEKRLPDNPITPIEAAKKAFPNKEIVIDRISINCSTSTIRKKIID